MYKEFTGADIAFFDLPLYMFVIGWGMVFLIWLYLITFLKPEKKEIEPSQYKALETIHTPNVRTIEEVSAFLAVSPQDIVKTLTYRPEFFGAPMGEVFQEVMREPSEWSIAERELMASFVSKTNECEF